MRKLAIAVLVAVVLALGVMLLRQAAPSDNNVAQALSKEAVLNDPAAPALIPAAHDVTMVLFFDYQCGVCRRVHPDLERLRQEDGRIRVVYKDWPIFGGISEQAARVAIAAHWQGKYHAVHDGLMRAPGRLSDKTIRAVASAAGVDWERLERDSAARASEIDALLARNSVQAAGLGFQGTPSFVIGPYLVPGGLDLHGLKNVVREARQNPVN